MRRAFFIKRVFYAYLILLCISSKATSWEGMYVNLDTDSKKEQVTFDSEKNQLKIYDDDGILLLSTQTQWDLIPKEEKEKGGFDIVKWHIWKTGRNEAIVITNSYGGMHFYEDIYIIHGWKVGEEGNTYWIKEYKDTKGAEFKDLNGDGMKELIIRDLIITSPMYYCQRAFAQGVWKDEKGAIRDMTRAWSVDSTVVLDQNEVSFCEAEKIVLPYVFVFQEGSFPISNPGMLKISSEVYNEWVENLSDVIEKLKKLKEKRKMKKVEELLTEIKEWTFPTEYLKKQEKMLSPDESRIRAAESDVTTIRKALILYEIDHGTYKIGKEFYSDAYGYAEFASHFKEYMKLPEYEKRFTDFYCRVDKKDYHITVRAKDRNKTKVHGTPERTWHE